ncbi:salicylate hydroxylase [Renibacterium salmoninarum ATCC 33209]|uniref:Salicylate hydroxylase n=2 Tax=Renibacterium salmoninarum TaxID=1646 RepID=A9WTP3_RENSM|nr:salicylate hydroxylase [Renibacterium salmoninarum ATCC 33209]
MFTSYTNTFLEDDMDILISGASVAGPTLAWWLRHSGFNPTVVERNPGGLRQGGQPIDVRGPALEVMARMGLRSALYEHRTAMRGMTMVDADGNEIMSSSEHTLTGGESDSPDVEILRDELAQLIFDASADIEYIFGDSISALAEHEKGVTVSFESGLIREFDLVIGADGLHSRTRSLTFGPGAEFFTPLHTHLGIFSTPNVLNLDHWQVIQQLFDPADPEAGTMGIFYSARGNSAVRAMLGFGGQLPDDFDYRNTDQQKSLVRAAFSKLGWVIPEILDAMEEASDFYFDSVGQIHLDRWHRGRIALVGDAAYCPSPLSGQGTSVALVGAFVLAGELAKHNAHQDAFVAYESELREWVSKNQALILTNADKYASSADSKENAAKLAAANAAFDAAVNGYQLKDYAQGQPSLVSARSEFSGRKTHQASQ